MPGAPAAAFENRYRRLSIFDPEARKAIVEIYEDLGKSAIFDGILFHDDATLSDYEDASPAALKFYADHWQLPASVQEIRQSDALRATWSKDKTAYIDAFTVTLADTLRQYQPTLFTARNLYAQPVLNPDSEEWYAQNLQQFLHTYDYTVIMAMPYMEGAADPDKWLAQLFGKVQAIPGALNKTIFELQSKDWKTGRPIDTNVLAAQMKKLHVEGARNYGYYPDDLQTDSPNEVIIKSVLSVEATLPVKPK
jgi:biofilm PGA synthesis lipoprotein PgaB